MTVTQIQEHTPIESKPITENRVKIRLAVLEINGNIALYRNIPNQPNTKRIYRLHAVVCKKHFWNFTTNFYNDFYNVNTQLDLPLGKSDRWFFISMSNETFVLFGIYGYLNIYNVVIIKVQVKFYNTYFLVIKTINETNIIMPVSEKQTV